MKRLYTGGAVITMTDKGVCEALMTENGRIAAVGREKDMDTKGAERVELRGQALLPAFIDAHSHFSQVASGFGQVSLTDVRDEGEIRARIETFIAQNEPDKGEWIMAGGFDGLALDAVDALAPDHPLMLQHASGHLGFFNKAARELLGLEQSLQKEGSYFAAASRVPLPSEKKTLANYKKAQRYYAGYGISQLQEGYVTKAMLPMLESLVKADLLKLNLLCYADLETFEPLLEMLDRLESKRVKLAGLKLFLDGSPQAKTAWLTKPYLGGEDCGQGAMTDAQVLEAMEFAGRHGAQILAHANGDAAIDQFLRCYVITRGKFVEERFMRPTLIHAQLMRRDQIDLAKKLGVIASFFIGHVYHYGDVHVQNLGMERASVISPVKSAMDAGLCVTFHQDSPVTPPDMLESVWCAVERMTRSGKVLGEGERVTVERALAAVTKNAAYQTFSEDENGALLAGRHADMAILSQNPLDCRGDELRKIKVSQLLIGDEPFKA